MLLCSNSSINVTLLSQPELRGRRVACDRSLADLLRATFLPTQTQARLRQLISFKKLTAIRFLQFGLYSNDLVNVTKLDDVPPSDHEEYVYELTGLLLPVGEKLMLHRELECRHL